MHRGLGRNTYDGKIAGLYDLEETLGRGHFAVVKLARHVFTGEKVAVKVIDKSKLDEISRAHLFQEVRCMKLVQHPNVVRLYEVIDTQTKLYLILELGDGGDLYDYIMRHEGGLGEEQAREYFRQIVRAISYCHRLHVVHRDLKPENVVFFERLGMVKLTDFGFSNRFNPGQKLETSCGSLAYSAPEILLGDSYDAPAVDVWSLGVILYMLVCGQAPFQEANDSETLTMIMDCKYTIPVHVSEACKRLIARMLIREPERRATLEEIAADPWLGEDINAEPADFLPLISREHVSDEDHALIIQKMVNGNIASKEEILEALDKNEYNHITATYFLLAERKLRAHRQEQAQRIRQGQGILTLPHQQSKPLVKIDTCLQESNSQDLVNQTQLNASRTPGDVPQSYRTRKCSIVQEEEDEDEMSACSGREDLTPPHNSLNRRGSRSEGRLNVALQERLAESERRKDKCQPVASPSQSVISRGAARDDISARKCSPLNSFDNRPKSAVESQNIVNTATVYIPGSTKWCPVQKYSGSGIAMTKNLPSIPSVKISYSSTSTIPTTSIITEASTISIPIHSSLSGTTLVPKYKTMPSPTRPVHTVLSSPQLALNEIFEEGDSATSESIVSHTNMRTLVNRHQGHSRPVGYEQRRTKFHKARTASCSSSDASDDDSESRKKRAHKLSSTGKSLTQRRDSHDDSSDSQDPGGNGGGAGGGSGSGGTRAGTNECTSGQTPSHNAGVSEGSRTSSGNSGNSGSTRRQSGGVSQQLPLGRHHRTGRRRPAETRLRESQSLNRITEVQEAEHSPSQIYHNHSNNGASVLTSNSTAGSASIPKVRGFGARLLQGWSLAGSSAKKNLTPENMCDSQCSQNKTSHRLASSHSDDSSFMRINHSVEKSISHCFSYKTDSVNDKSDVPSGSRKSGSENSKTFSIPISNCCSEEKENCCKTSSTKSSEKQKSSGSKKGRLLGRYFQVHKKLCLPLPGLFGRGRLYKAQSCGSIVRDHVATQSPASLLLCADDRWCSIAGKVSGAQAENTENTRKMGT